MKQVVLELPSKVYAKITDHLLPSDPQAEEAAFIFARFAETKEGRYAFRFIDWHKVNTGGFVFHSMDGIELTDQERACVIQRAHQLRSSLIELHSHPFPLQAAFSLSDCRGFVEFVPHVRWRLDGRPYAALVFGPDDFDGLVWREESPEQLAGIQVDGTFIRATAATLERIENGRSAI